MATRINRLQKTLTMNNLVITEMRKKERENQQKITIGKE